MASPSSSFPAKDAKGCGEHSDVQKERTCMSLCIWLFRVVGCWPEVTRIHQTSERLYLCFTAFVCFVQTSYLTGLMYGMLLKFGDSLELNTALEDLIVFITGVIVLIKIILILAKHDEIQKFIDYLNFGLNEREIRDEEDLGFIRECVRHEKYLTQAYVGIGYFLIFDYFATSFAVLFRSLKSNKYALPLNYSFRPEGVLYYLTFMHQLTCFFLNGHIGTLMDVFFSSLVYYICGHFKILQSRIRKEGGFITRRFVAYHNELIGLIKHIQQIFGPLLLFTFALNSSLICFGLILLTQISFTPLLQFIKVFTYIIIKVSQLFLYCWYGQEVIEKGNSISNEVYFGSWHEFGAKEKTENIKIVLLRSQKPVKIRFGMFLVISLATLQTVMNVAYSFFTVYKSWLVRQGH